MNKKESQQELLTRGVDEIVVVKDLEKKLDSGKKLRVKHGVDPTTADLHLGYAVVYEKLRQFQELGHVVVFLIGDFTARFGDPTDQKESRTLRTKEETMKTGKNYIKQLGKILDIDKVEVRYNGEWGDKMSAEDLIHLVSKFTVALWRRALLFRRNPGRIVAFDGSQRKSRLQLQPVPWQIGPWCRDLRRCPNLSCFQCLTVGGRTRCPVATCRRTRAVVALFARSGD